MAALKFRKPCADDGSFLPWIKRLCGRSGVYVIRSGWFFKKVLYVGESHTQNLSKTLKRHFFSWKDDPIRKHKIYDRHKVEVAVRLLPAKKAVAAQNRLIIRLTPEDNAYIPAADKPF